MKYRLLEFIPGVLAWGTIAAVIGASWRFPEAAAIFIILFDIYWLFKTIYLSLHLRAAFRRMRANMQTDWLAKLSELQPTNHLPTGQAGNLQPHWRNIHHLVIMPMAHEPYEIIRESFEALKASHYPKDRLIVVLAREARIPESDEIAQKITQEFSGVFAHLLATAHPDGLIGEIRGKGSNEAWAAAEVKRAVIDPASIPYDDIIVSVFDADTQTGPEYFGVLTHAFLKAPPPLRSSYQPIPLFVNNIFQAPALARVIAFASSFWHMIQQARPERLTTFSSHAMPFKALVEIGYWRRDIVSEDSNIFWQCYLHYDGDWRTVPIFYPAAMDANVAPTFWHTMKNLYRQQRRWAWGPCENIPYFLNGFIRNRRISFAKKCYWSFHYIEGAHSWATNSLIIFSLGWLPLILGDASFNLSVLSYNLPRITRTVMNFAMIGVASSSILAILLLPPKPAWFRKRHYALYLVQWLLMPVHLIIFGSLPALEAQTRVMLGGRWRLGFWPTPKHR